MEERTREFCLDKKLNPKHELQGSRKKRTDSKEAREKNHYSGNEKKIEMRGRKRKMMNKYEVRVSDFIPIVVDSLAICVFSRWCVVKSLTFRSFVIFFVPSLVSFYMCYTR